MEVHQICFWLLLVKYYLAFAEVVGILSKMKKNKLKILQGFN
jgi:hypothetical protein